MAKVGGSAVVGGTHFRIPVPTSCQQMARGRFNGIDEYVSDQDGERDTSGQMAERLNSIIIWRGGAGLGGMLQVPYDLYN